MFFVGCLELISADFVSVYSAEYKLGNGSFGLVSVKETEFKDKTCN